MNKKNEMQIISCKIIGKLIINFEIIKIDNMTGSKTDCSDSIATAQKSQSQFADCFGLFRELLLVGGRHDAPDH